MKIIIELVPEIGNEKVEEEKTMINLKISVFCGPVSKSRYVTKKGEFVLKD